MRRLFLLSWILLLPAAPAAAQENAEGERDLAEERALERKCLECHNDPALYGARASGELRSIHVDPERYRTSIHYEKDYTCLTCHPDASPDYHPREGVKIRACGDCHDHEDELADFEKSRHGILLAEGAEDAADCFHCHANHYTRPKDDPMAFVNAARIRKTCGACHPAEAEQRPQSAWWSAGRVSAHGKADLSEPYVVDDCKRCHQGPDTHKMRPLDERGPCVACHGRFEEARPAGLALAGSVHLATEESPERWLSGVRTLGFLVALGAFLAVMTPPLVLVLRFRARRKKKEETPGGE